MVGGNVVLEKLTAYEINSKASLSKEVATATPDDKVMGVILLESQNDNKHR